MLFAKVENEIGVLKVEYDTDVESPRTSCDNFGTMVCWHRRYSLGDEHSYSDSYDFWYDLACNYVKNTDKLDEKSQEQLRAIVEDKIVLLPLYLYDHSGITISTTPFGCRWDSCQVGYIYATKEDIRKEYGIQRVTKKYIEKATALLKGEVETYDQYLTGDVYGFVLEDKQGEEINSCWGFYGSDMKQNGIVDHLPDEYRGLVDLIA